MPLKDEIIEKINKLLNLGGEGSSHEEKAALEKAAKLMEKHELQMADVKGYTSKSAIQEVRIEGYDRHATQWEAQLANETAIAFDCKLIINQNYRDSKWEARFYGKGPDLELTRYFFTYLRNYVVVLADKKFKSGDDKTTYCWSFVLEVTKRLREMKEQKESILTSETTALVHVKTAAVERRVAELYPNIRTEQTKPSIKGSQEAFIKGREDGRNAPINRPLNDEHKSRQQLS